MRTDSDKNTVMNNTHFVSILFQIIGGKLLEVLIHLTPPQRTYTTLPQIKEYWKTNLKLCVSHSTLKVQVKVDGRWTPRSRHAVTSRVLFNIFPLKHKLRSVLQYSILRHNGASLVTLLPTFDFNDHVIIKKNSYYLFPPAL